MRENITLMLNGKVEQIPPINSSVTLMNWLRNDKNLTGTKEGCAEGDCGACTVVMGKYNHNLGEVTWRAVNSCILFLPMLDGCSIRTVEGLAYSEDDLHPVQTAFIENHASQCGFCTPGFVMSLYAAWCKKQKPEASDIDNLFAGNLCRCTGYLPIKKAALQIGAIPEEERDTNYLNIEEDFVIQNLKNEPLSINLKNEKRHFRFDAPKDIKLVGQILQEKDPLILSGATDIGLWVTKKHMEIGHFLYLGELKELNLLNENQKGFEIGASVSHELAMQKLGSHFEALLELWRRFGSEQVRASGTVVGNIANGSPIADISPAFIALGASLTISHLENKRVIPIQSFFISYGKQDLKKGEFIKSVYVPKLEKNQRFECFKISRRFDQDISAVMGAFLFSISEDGFIEKAQIAYGGMAGIPKEASNLSQLVLGKELGNLPLDDCKKALKEDFQPITDVRASQEYRNDIAFNLFLKACNKIAGKPFSYLPGAVFENVDGTSLIKSQQNV